MTKNASASKCVLLWLREGALRDEAQQKDEIRNHSDDQTGQIEQRCESGPRRWRLGASTIHETSSLVTRCLTESSSALKRETRWQWRSDWHSTMLIDGPNGWHVHCLIYCRQTIFFNPILFASCTCTFSKWCKSNKKKKKTWRGALSSTPPNPTGSRPSMSAGNKAYKLYLGVGVLLAADSQSTSKSRYRASLWDPWPEFILLFFRLTITSFCYQCVLSDEKTGL
jgi:hypothetical protein